MDLSIPLGRVRSRRADGPIPPGKDALLSDEHGSRISFEDYAVALVDEIERPAHVRQRFTVGY